MMNKFICGIDIGSTGACVVRKPNGKFLAFKPEKYVKLFQKLSAHKDKTIVYIEKLHAFPKMSSKAVWGMAQNQGVVIGILDALEIPYVWVPAQRWQKPLELPKKQEYPQRKANLSMKAMEIFPDEKLFKYNADAYLICDYAIKMEEKNEKVDSNNH